MSLKVPDFTSSVYTTAVNVINFCFSIILTLRLSYPINWHSQRDGMKLIKKKEKEKKQLIETNLYLLELQIIPHHR